MSSTADNQDGPATLMASIGQAVTRGREGDTDGARHDLLNIWERIAGTADTFHRCVLAHYVADLHSPAEAIVWDERTLEAANEATNRAEDEAADEQTAAAAAQVAGFYPSLHLNLADNHRRLGSFDTANTHMSTARDLASSLPAGPYAEQMEQWIEQVADLISKQSIEPLPGQAGTGDGGEE